MPSLRTLCATVAGAALFAMTSTAMTSSAMAQNWPTRSVQTISPFTAGNANDIVARIVLDQVGRSIGQSFVIENRPGGGGRLGASVVAKADPDGYTVLLLSSSLASHVVLHKTLPYDPIKDFTPVALLQQGYFILTVRPESGWKTVAELTAAMKQKGAKASYGYGSPPALGSAELYKARAGLQAVSIPYRTAMQSLPQMFAGELDFQFFDSTQGTPLIAGGKLRGLAITAGKRVPGVDLPTMAEAANIPEFDISPTWGVFLPAGAPQSVVDRLESWFGQITKMDSTKLFLSRTHASSFPGDAKALAAFIPKEIKKWKELAKLAKIQPR